MEKEYTLKKAEAIHREDVEGLKKLSFYEDKLRVLEERLWELTCKYTSFELRDRIADFREEIMMKHHEANEMKAAFTEEEFETVYKLERLKERAGLGLQKARELHERMGYFQKEVKELWVRVNDFLSLWM